MINMLDKTIKELEKYLTSLIKADYENNETVTRHSICRTIKEATENRHLIDRGNLFELYIESKDTNIEVYIEADVITGKSRNNVKIRDVCLDVRIPCYDRVEKEFIDKIFITRDMSTLGGIREKLTVASSLWDRSINDLVSLLYKEGNGLNTEYINELNLMKVQPLVQFITIQSNQEEHDRFCRLMGVNMKEKFYSQPLKGEVSKYLIENIIEEITVQSSNKDRGAE